MYEADQSGALVRDTNPSQKNVRKDDHLLAGILSLLDASPSGFHH